MTKRGNSKIFTRKNSKFFVNLPGKVEIFRQFAWKLKFFPGKIEILGKFSGINQIFLTRIHVPQISNQIDAAGPQVGFGPSRSPIWAAVLFPKIQPFLRKMYVILSETRQLHIFRVMKVS